MNRSIGLHLSRIEILNSRSKKTKISFECGSRTPSLIMWIAFAGFTASLVVSRDMHAHIHLGSSIELGIKIGITVTDGFMSSKDMEAIIGDFLPHLDITGSPKLLSEAQDSSRNNLASQTIPARINQWKDKILEAN